MTRSPWDRWAAVGGAAFVVLYILGFAIGAEPGKTDQEILSHYASSSSRNKEAVTFFLIAAAALALVVFANALRGRVHAVDPMLSLVAWTGATGCAALIFAGDAISRATAFSAMDKDFHLDPNTQRLFETAGFLLYVTAALAAILLVGSVAIATLRRGVFPRWLGWLSVAVAILLPLAIGFIGFLAFLVWILVVSGVLAFGRAPGPARTAPET